MRLDMKTLTEWSEAWWNKLGPIYQEAFTHGAKPERVLRSMLERGIACLHAGMVGDEAIAMAVTGFRGKLGNRRLILDYMAVRDTWRGKGFGTRFFMHIRDWAVREHQVKAMIIEAEAMDTETNRNRLAFWHHCGFIETPYVHQYIWVPEPYRALALPLSPDFRITDDGRSLFHDITSFHQQSFRNSS
ncbi:GNAT family N-acetyltransferase [Paenibacillus sp. 7541]|uniref:GNAT family N-acetyltransferase n=1 Tax=Paenibacillus sp. 7541 TaxID=2026236 RepID=UPI000BA72AF1|nr:GNAT family N-acetyltransferase [Paenibacillus sp. 7541]PAK55902.1 GNAT family N-acetyltransferase [Paenibacillus sp. 7541]